jgi:hypothetical protein
LDLLKCFTLSTTKWLLRSNALLALEMSVLLTFRSDLCGGSRVILKWIYKNRMGERVLDRAVSGWGELTGCCVHGNEL